MKRLNVKKIVLEGRMYMDTHCNTYHTVAAELYSARGILIDSFVLPKPKYGGGRQFVVTALKEVARRGHRSRFGPLLESAPAWTRSHGITIETTAHEGLKRHLHKAA